MFDRSWVTGTAQAAAVSELSRVADQVVAQGRVFIVT
jgi:hypothetical protein